MAFFCFISVVFGAALAGDKTEPDAKPFAIFHVAWAIATAFLTLVFWMSDINVSITQTTVLIASIVWGILVIDLMTQKFLNSFRQKKERIKEEEAAKQQAFVDRIIKLVGDAPQTKALLSAIERLTPHAKEEAGRILGALSRDSERYVMLRALQETTTNDVLRAESGREADEISLAARTLCADATEMALELLREYQTAEAEKSLGFGDQRGSELARASEDFREYLRGLRKVTEHLGPGAEETLRQDIDALGPQTEVKELLPKADRSRRLRSGD
ncbi:MAG: hypothetical protein JWN89_366 [Parcubacteria group bacterium]|nr:hypothetical protein [Parcubacteria group bacterium]